ncbi:MAG: M20/M25/M40 family metallo-hydrolase [Planctomycetota bacterium]
MISLLVSRLSSFRAAVTIAVIAVVAGFLVGSGPASSPISTPAAGEWPREVERAFRTIKPKECYDHVKVLASDEYEGRECGTEGARKAGDYVSEHFRRMGLVPGGVDGTYFQPFSVRLKRQTDGPMELGNRVRLFRKATDKKATTLEFIDEFVPLADSPDRSVAGSLSVLDLTQEGAPSGDEFKDSVALVRAGSEPITKETLNSWHLLGIRGALILTDDKKTKFEPDAWPAGDRAEAARVAAVRLTQKGSDQLLKKLGSSTAKFFGGERPDAAKLAQARLELDVSRRGYVYGRGRNVIGVIPAKEGSKLASECIVIGAHYDHVGRPTNPQVTNGRLGEIHNGADDNASGTTGLIELAEAFMERDIRTSRNIVIMAFDAEEAGLLGSKYYVTDPPPYPIEKTVAMINMDMISRNGAQDMKIGKLDRFAGLNSIMNRVARSLDIELDPSGMQQYIRRSDQWPFMEAGVPAVFLYGGDHPEYHTERDDLELINPNKITNITRLLFLSAYELANHEGSFKE